MAITGNTIFDHFLKKLTLGTADNIQHPSGTFNPLTKHVLTLKRKVNSSKHLA